MLTPESIKQMQEVIASGYAGVLPDGRLVDRREHPTATPIQENSLLNVPKPKKLSQQDG